MRSYACLIAATFLLLVPMTVTAATPTELSAAVTEQYRITIPGFFGNFKAIGDLLTPRKDGLRADRPSNRFSPNVILHHRLITAGGGNLPLGNAHTGALKPGERLYLYGISTGDNYLQMDLYSVATYVVPGLRGPTALQASVRFRYDGGLQGITTQQLLDDIHEWFDTVEDRRPVPKPYAAARTPRTIRLGQTADEVVAAFGTPDKQLLLGAKTIFVYCDADLKVVLQDGKVVDAE